MDVAVRNDRYELIAELVGDDAARRQMAIGSAYDGASKIDKALATWQPPIRSADMDMLPEKGIGDARVQDLMRNDGYAQTGQQLHRDNIVGAQYTLNAKPDWKTLGLDETWADEFQEEVESKFTLGVESQGKYIDAARTNTFTAMIRLAVGVYTVSGEVLASVEWMRNVPRPFHTAIQMIDVARLSTPWEEMGNGRVRGGVRQDRFGAPLGYYIRDAHPSDYDRIERMEHTYVTARHPWGRDKILHFKEQMRVDQTRGFSELVAGLKELRITKQFRDVTLQNAVVGAMYAASIESELPDEAVFTQMGAGNMTPGVAAATYAQEYLAALSEYAGSTKHMQIDGVKIPHFFPGTKLQLRPVSTPGGVGQDFEASLLRYTAALLGVSYEELSRDFSKANYATMRGGVVNTWKFMQSRKRMVADQMATSIYALWLEEQINANVLTTVTPRSPNFYDGLNKEAYTSGYFIGAARGQIDELKETQAASLRIKGLLSTHEDELGRLGKDWRSVYRQLAREKKMREELDIEMVEDNALNAATGENPTREPNDPDKAIAVSMDVSGMAEIMAATTNASTAAQHEMVAAIRAMAERHDEPPTMNFSVQPNIALNVKSRNGKTTTRVVAYDDKGRILGTETTPEDDNEDEA